MAESHGQVPDFKPQSRHELVFEGARTRKNEHLGPGIVWIFDQSAIPKHGDSQIMVGSILLIRQVGREFIQVGLGQSVETEAEKDGRSGMHHSHRIHCDRIFAPQKL